MYVNGLGFRAIERVMGVAHTTVIDWLAQVGECLPDAYAPESIPQVGELDELETFVGRKRNKIWIWTVSTTFSQGFWDGLLATIAPRLSARYGKRLPVGSVSFGSVMAIRSIPVLSPMVTRL